MAQRTVVTLVDDLTGEEGENVTNVEFGIDGAVYEIDLDERNANELRDVLAVYVENGRRTGRTNGGHARGGGRRATTPAPTARRTTVGSAGPRSREASKAIRDWAKSQNIEVSERGRIPAAVVEKYDAAH